MKRPLITSLALLLLFTTGNILSAQLSYKALKTDTGLHSLAFTGPSPINISEIKAAIQYPEAAQEAGIEGEVICKVLISKDGTYIKHRIIKSPGHLLGEAVDPHLARLQFVPAIKNGRQIPVWTTLRFVFSLTDGTRTQKPTKVMQTKIWEQSAAALREAGDYSKAYQLLKKARATADEALLPDLFKQSAQLAMLAGDYVEARTSLTNLLHLTTNQYQQAEILHARAVCALLQNKPELATGDLARSHNVAPEYYPELTGLQRYLALDEIQISEAVRFLQELSSRENDPLPTYLALRVAELDQ